MLLRQEPVISKPEAAHQVQTRVICFVAITHQDPSATAEFCFDILRILKDNITFRFTLSTLSILATVSVH